MDADGCIIQYTRNHVECAVFQIRIISTDSTPLSPSLFWMLGHLNIYPTAQWQSRLSTSIQVFQPENGSARHLHDNSKHSGKMKHIFMDTYVWAMIDVESRTIFREHRLRDTERASSSETLFLLILLEAP